MGRIPVDSGRIIPSLALSLLFSFLFYIKARSPQLVVLAVLEAIAPSWPASCLAAPEGLQCL
jgi:hypothetical protein